MVATLWLLCYPVPPHARNTRDTVKPAGILERQAVLTPRHVAVPMRRQERMVNFAASKRVEACFLEQTRQRCPIRMVLPYILRERHQSNKTKQYREGETKGVSNSPEIVYKIPRSGGVWPSATQEGVARGSTHCDLGEGPIKSNATFRQLINIGRVLPLHSIRAQLWP